MKKHGFQFGISVEADNRTGEIGPVYVYVRTGRVTQTKEYADGRVFADYNKDGELLGFEILEPCEARILDRIAKQQATKRFIKDSIPRGMLVGAS